MNTQQFIEHLRGARVVGVLRADQPETAHTAAHAGVRGGLQSVELTFTTPGAADVIRALRAELPPRVTVGAGTVMTRGQALAALEAGADFLVSPHLDAEVAGAARERGAIYLPGALTPSEIVTALRWDVPAVKIFPAGSSGGVAYLRDLLGPFPQLRAMVTGGVRPGEVSSYLRAGALAVGLGSNLFPPGALRERDEHAVEQATRAALREAGLEG